MLDTSISMQQRGEDGLSLLDFGKLCIQRMLLARQLTGALILITSDLNVHTFTSPSL